MNLKDTSSKHNMEMACGFFSQDLPVCKRICFLYRIIEDYSSIHFIFWDDLVTRRGCWA